MLYLMRWKRSAALRCCDIRDNRGKGYALRHGMQYLLQYCQACAFVVTADADGQHTVEDIIAVGDALHADATGLLLGTRDFSASHVPGKSRAGNRITSKVFHMLYGQKVEDTQTGLRGFSRDLLPQFLRIRGDRYDYEMNQLIHCAIEGIPLRTLPIETVYENNNEGSHFRAVVDSWRNLPRDPQPLCALCHVVSALLRGGLRHLPAH